jgi:hypothetical protein
MRQNDEDVHPSHWSVPGHSSLRKSLYILNADIERDLGSLQAKVYQEVACFLVEYLRKALGVDSLIVQVLEDGVAGHGGLGLMRETGLSEHGRESARGTETC